MKEAGAGLLALQKYRSHLYGLCAKSQGSDYAARIRDATGGDHRHIDCVGNLRDERKCACKRILGGAKERTTMSSGFEPRSDDRIHAGLLKRSSLFGGGRRAYRDDV